MIQDEPFVLGGKEFQSRLIIGTGKYPSMELMQQCHEASGADMVTVAIRRMELPGTSKTLLDYIDRDRFTILPNTAGCYDAESAILTAKLAREAGLSDFIKLEVIGDQKTLYPDTEELLKATQALVKEGFIVMPYTTDDVVVAKKLEDAGAAAVMPLGAPIGSGLGVCNPYTIRLIMEAVSIPVIVDAGVGTASDAAIAMEIGVDAVLMNTAIAGAQDPLAMAHAMRLAVEAGHFAYKAGRIPRKLYATASSPLEGIIGTT
jgi:thiazole synthase